MATSRRTRLYQQRKWRRDMTFTSVAGDDFAPEDDAYEETPLGRVYVLLDAEAAQIKIGYSLNVARRQYEHESARRRKLDLLGTMRGGRKLEAALLARFKPYLREGQEWFSSEIAVDLIPLLD